MAASFYDTQSFFDRSGRNGNTNHNAPSLFGYEPSIFKKVVFFFNSCKQLFTCLSVTWPIISTKKLYSHNLSFTGCDSIFARLIFRRAKDASALCNEPGE